MIRKSYLFHLPLCFLLSVSALAKGVFNNKSLGELLETRKDTIVYVWSPNMPISWKGRAETKALAQRIGVDFLELRDPHAHSKDADKEASLKLGATKLFELGVLNHFPTVIVIKNGKINKKIIQGYEVLGSLEKMIKARLKND